MQRDAGIPITVLKVDGGLSRSDVLCTVQADVLGVPVLRPFMDERTALGAAFAAGLAPGVEVWTGVEDLVKCTSRGIRTNASQNGENATETEICDCSTDKQGNVLCEAKDEEKHSVSKSVYSSSPACLLEASKAQFQVFEPHPASKRDAMRKGWAKAVEKSMGWAE